jgi:cell division protein FtsB
LTAGNCHSREGGNLKFILFLDSRLRGNDIIKYMRLRGIQEEPIFKKSFWRSKILALVLLCLVILISFPLLKKIKQQRALDAEIKELQAEGERITNRNKDLRELINYLSGDSFAEKEARLNLNLKKPGEKVAVIKNGEIAEGRTATSSAFNIPGLNKEEPPEIINNSRKWWNYFFSQF